MDKRPFHELISERFSCRAFEGKPLAPAVLDGLGRRISAVGKGPFGSAPPFAVIAAKEGDEAELKGLGTYGFVKNPRAFIAGTIAEASREVLVDYGYRLESMVLETAAMGLGSCILGGSFSRSRFAQALKAKGLEGEIPCVVAVGHFPRGRDPREGLLRRAVGGASRKPWAELFSMEGKPLEDDEAGRKLLGPFAAALDALRSAPSASNKQPWRMRREDGAWKLYLKRSPGYGSGLVSRILGVADLQLVDIGIAMANFSISARELGLPGGWKALDEAEGPSGLIPIAQWA